ncbi:hypothetical protein ILYODFUR_034723 [Ilyodon furcidens]|uniref:Uncharacterized protein n=1 Tax=Ilyodon furcidens TaxID=33524 RepID=A0ABV0V8K2_9TELE
MTGEVRSLHSESRDKLQRNAGTTSNVQLLLQNVLSLSLGLCEFPVMTTRGRHKPKHQIRRDNIGVKPKQQYNLQGGTETKSHISSVELRETQICALGIFQGRRLST